MIGSWSNRIIEGSRCHMRDRHALDTPERDVNYVALGLVAEFWNPSALERTAVEVSKPDQMASKLGRLGLLQDEPGGVPFTGQAVPGMEAARAWSAAFTRNVERLMPILRACSRQGAGGREGAR